MLLDVDTLLRERNIKMYEPITKSTISYCLYGFNSRMHKRPDEIYWGIPKPCILSRKPLENLFLVTFWLFEEGDSIISELQTFHIDFFSKVLEWGTWSAVSAAQGSLVWCLWLSFGAETFCLGFQTVRLNSANTTECSGQSLLQNSFGNAVQFGPRPYLSPAHRPRSLMTLTAPRKSAVSESLPPHKASRRLLIGSGKFFRGRKQHFMMSKISVWISSGRLCQRRSEKCKLEASNDSGNDSGTSPYQGIQV